MNIILYIQCETSWFGVCSERNTNQWKHANTQPIVTSPRKTVSARVSLHFRILLHEYYYIILIFHV